MNTTPADELKSINILHVEDAKMLADKVKFILRSKFPRLTQAENGGVGLDAFKSGNFDIVITDVSGRGVGMDVVRKNIDKIRGIIDIQSKSGKGTKITFRIPLALAIMDAMILRAGEEKYAMPILSVMESFQANNSDISVTMDGVEIVRVRGELFPVVRLAELMNSRSDNQEIPQGILLKIISGDKSICLLVDEILDQAQAVVKPLSKYIGDVGGVTGCMVMPDGKIGLILNADSLIEKSTIISENIPEMID